MILFWVGWIVLIYGILSGEADFENATFGIFDLGILSMKKFRDIMVKIIYKIDGFFLQFYPELTKHMRKREMMKNLIKVLIIVSFPTHTLSLRLVLSNQTYQSRSLKRRSRLMMFPIMMDL